MACFQFFWQFFTFSIFKTSLSVETLFEFQLKKCWINIFFNVVFFSIDCVIIGTLISDVCRHTRGPCEGQTVRGGASTTASSARPREEMQSLSRHAEDKINDGCGKEDARPAALLPLISQVSETMSKLVSLIADLRPKAISRSNSGHHRDSPNSAARQQDGVVVGKLNVS